MPREYYDRGPTAQAAEHNLTPASLPLQDGYSLLRSQLTSAVARNWQDVLDSSPEIRQASDNLEIYLQRHSNRTFRIFRPEDLAITTDAGSSPFFK